MFHTISQRPGTDAHFSNPPPPPHGVIFKPPGEAVPSHTPAHLTIPKDLVRVGGGGGNQFNMR